MRARALFLFFVCCLTLLLFLQKVEAQDSTPVFSDDFSDLHAWTEVFNGRDDNPSQPCRDPTEQPKWGTRDHEVGIRIDGSLPCSTVLQPNLQQPFMLRRWEEKFRFRITNKDMDRNLLIRWQDSQNYLNFHIFGQGVVFEKMIGGIGYTADSWQAGYSFHDNTSYAVDITVDLSTRETVLRINDNAILDLHEYTNDPQLTQGAPGLRASVGAVRESEVWFSEYHLLSLEESRLLDIPPLLQTDQRWQSELYDAAQIWSPNDPTIGRWGCALTSAVMVLRFYGITSFPDTNHEITPSTLNTWLREQKDGYLVPGLVNWRALSRLSAEYGRVHNHQTPDLEFTYEQPEEKLSWLQSQLATNLPIILEEDQHFLLAYGTGPGQADIEIRDPYFPFSRLESYQNTYRSARVFTPSHTDLSAVTLVTSPGTRAWLNGDDGTKITTPPVLEGFPRDPFGGSALTNAWQVFDFPKLGSGSYTAHFESWDASPQVVSVAAYSRTGVAHVEKLYVSTSSAKLQFSFERESDNPFSVETGTTPFATSSSSLASSFPGVSEIVKKAEVKLQSADLSTKAAQIENWAVITLGQAVQAGWWSKREFWDWQELFHQRVLQKFP